jgi:hypothetical protein
VLYPPNVPMVPSSVVVATIGGECLSCDGFSLGETIRFGNLEFITDSFSGLSHSHLGDGSSIVVMGPVHGGPLLL